MNNFELDYLQLLSKVLRAFGEPRSSRVGPTRQTFGTTLRIDCLRQNKFPLLTTRRIYTRGIFGELAAFLKGATSLLEFQEEGCNYWDDNAAKWSYDAAHPKRALQVGRIYGAQWRNWEGDDGFQGLDQIDALIQSISTDPMGRRHLLTAYNPAELHLACLPPCHILAQFNVSGGYLDVLVTMRSVDLCLGLPSDIVLYAALLILVARETGYEPGTILFSMGDSHIYCNHTELLEEQLLRPVRELPGYDLRPGTTLENFSAHDLTFVDYNPSDPIKFPLNA